MEGSQNGELSNEYRELEIVRLTDQIITTLAAWPVDIEVKIAALQSAASVLTNAVGMKASLTVIHNHLNKP